jgi:hypothetical protein
MKRVRSTRGREEKRREEKRRGGRGERGERREERREERGERREDRREKRRAYKILVGKPEGKKPLGRFRCSWEDNVKMYLKEIRYEDTD